MTEAMAAVISGRRWVGSVGGLQKGAGMGGKAGGEGGGGGSVEAEGVMEGSKGKGW